MGISIVLTTRLEIAERTKLMDIPQERRTGDPLNLFLGYAYRSENYSTSSCLKFIDVYGQAYFNRLQMPVFIEEVREARGSVTDITHLEIFNKIENLALCCRDGRDLFLRFIGD